MVNIDCTDLRETQLKIEGALQKMPGIRFVISSCTAISTKIKDVFSFGVALFIISCQTEKVTHQSIFNKIYDQEADLDVRVSKIKTRNVKSLDNDDIILAKLKQVVKVQNDI